MKKILLIDDNAQDRLLYRRYLGPQLGHERLEYLEAASGAEGLAQFQAQQPDCVLLDHNLPDTDGLHVLEQLLQLAPPDTVCVVMITGGGSEALAVRALNLGALDYLVKQQFDRELLVKTVGHAIEKNEWRQYVGRYHNELHDINQRLRDSLAELTAARKLLHARNQELAAANQQVQARNQELATANQQLARTNADLDNFVYAASHDLKQPVNNLRGLFDELCRTATFDDPEAPLVLRLFDDSLRSLGTTITDLAAVVQQARNPVEQRVELIDLNNFTTELLRGLQPDLLSAQAEISTDFTTLPTVRYVPGALRTILLNLLTNALKYRHPDRRPQVWLRSGRAGGQPELTVQDNGLGIDLARHSTELFQLFRRFHPQAGEGTGVGLFLVNRLVEGYGGRIDVESVEGQGTTFRVLL